MLQKTQALQVFDLRSPFSSNINRFDSTRESLISFLAHYPGLSCKQLAVLVEKSKNGNISPQAVYKTLNQLVEEGVLIKNERKYFLDETWVCSGKKFFEEAVKKQDSPAEMVMLI
jgi:predicted transcriptional regulator